MSFWSTRRKNAIRIVHVPSRSVLPNWPQFSSYRSSMMSHPTVCCFYTGKSGFWRHREKRRERKEETVGGGEREKEREEKEYLCVGNDRGRVLLYCLSHS